MKTVENDDLVPEAELYELFIPRRADPTAFRDGVERRIAERERKRAQEGERAEATTWRTQLARHAAAVLPPDVATTLALGKPLSFALALPALVLAAILGVFAASVRSVRRSSREAAPAREVDWKARTTAPLNRDMSVGRGLLFTIQMGALAAMFAPFIAGARHAVDVLVAVLLLAMATVSVTLRGFASASYLTRGEAAKLCASLLTTVFVSCFLWSSTGSLIDGASELGLGWSANVVLLGSVACAVLGARHDRLARRMLPLTALFAAVLVFVFPSIWLTAGARDTREYVVEFHADTSELSGWKELAASVAALRSAREDVPDLARVRSAIESAIDSGADAHPHVWTAAADMGLIDAPHWRTLAARRLEAYRLDQTLASGGELHWSDYNAYELDMLLATRELSAAECERLLERVRASWPPLDAPNPLDKAALCVRSFDALGRGGEVDLRRDEIHAILRRHWVSGSDSPLFAKVGGFTSFPDKFATSFHEPAWDAVELMARVGAPPEIDLRLFRGHLRAESSKSLVPWNMFPVLGALERATLLRLEREIGLPKRGWLGTLLGERVLIASLLVVALCIAAIRAAPPSGVDALTPSRGSSRPPP